MMKLNASLVKRLLISEEFIWGFKTDILKMTRDFGEDNEIVYNMQYELFGMLKSRNDNDEALDLITDMVRRAKRTLGPGHNVTKVYEAALSEHQTKMSSKESK